MRVDGDIHGAAGIAVPIGRLYEWPAASRTATAEAAMERTPATSDVPAGGGTAGKKGAS
jgi:hypothetical protein